jgi:hypothetical protein
MTEKRPPIAIEQVPGVAGENSALASANAPVIFAESAPCYGYTMGLIAVTLEAQRHHMTHEGVLSDRVTVAHLKLTTSAAIMLRDALNSAIAIGERPKGPPN